jgi:hypothetical protein
MKNCSHRWTPCYGDILSLVWTTLAEGAQVTPLLLVQQAVSEMILVDVAEPFVGIATSETQRTAVLRASKAVSWARRGFEVGTKRATTNHT